MCDAGENVCANFRAATVVTKNPTDFAGKAVFVLDVRLSSSPRRMRLSTYIASKLRTDEIASLIHIENTGKRPPVEEASCQLSKCFQGLVPDWVLDLAIDSCRSNAEANFSLLVAVLGGAANDNHSLAYSAICDQLRNLSSRFEAKKTSLKDALHRLSYLFGLLRHVQLDARRRILPPLPEVAIIRYWSQQLRDLASDNVKLKLAVSVLPEVLVGLRELDEGPRFLEDVSFWSTLAGSDLDVLSRMLSIVQGSWRGHSELLRANEIVTGAIEATYPSLDTFKRFVEGNQPEQIYAEIIEDARLGKNFSRRCRAVARTLTMLGREVDSTTLFSELAERLKDKSLRLHLAKVLLSARGLGSVLLGASLIQDDRSDYSPEVVAVNLHAKMVCADWVGLKDLLDRAPSGSIPVSTSYEAKMALADFDSAALLFDRISSDATRELIESPSNRNFSQLIFCEKERPRLDFLRETAKQLAITGPREVKGVVVFVDNDWLALTDAPLLALAELKRRGYAILALHPGLFPNQPCGISEIDDIHAQIGSNFSCTRWAHQHKASYTSHINNWEVDLEQERATCCGVNLYQGLFESLCCEFRRYSLDYGHPLVRAKAARRLLEMDLVVDCINRLKSISSRHSVPIRVLGVSHHLASGYAACHLTAKNAVDSDLAFFGTSSGYDNYYANFTQQTASTISLQNLTKNADQSRATVVSKSEFDRWYRETWLLNSDRQELNEKSVLEVVYLNRVRRHKVNRQSAKMLRELTLLKGEGKTIVCLFGKVLFDQGVPRDGGPAHQNMRDWFQHCYELANRNKNLILLIKPHPHEVRDEIALFPSEVLRDWLPKNLPSNIIFLEHDMFNVHEIHKVIDLGLVWCSTVCLELGVLGVPCMVGSWYGSLDYPVGHLAPNDRSHFEEIIDKAKDIKPPAEIAERCKALIAYMKSEHVATPYRYVVRALTNKHLREAGWIREDVERYQKLGDPYVKFLADRIDEVSSD